MPTYTFTAPQLSRLLGEAIRLFQSHRDRHGQPEAGAKPVAVRAVMVLLDEAGDVRRRGVSQYFRRRVVRREQDTKP